MKLLEEDEDENMHSGADVEAFTAALNRDIEGDASTSQPSDCDSAALSQGSNHTSSQFPQWQTSSHDENASYQSQQDAKGLQQHSSVMELKQHGSGLENPQRQMDTSQSQDDFPQQQAEQNSLKKSQTMTMQDSVNNPGHVQEPERAQNLETELQYQRLQKMSNQQAIAAGQAVNVMNRTKQVPFALLLPVIEPQLEKDRAMQLQNLYNRLKKNEISKDGFVKHMRSLVGDQMLKMAVYKLQAQAVRSSQSGPNHFPSQSQVSTQHLQMPSISAKHTSDSQAFSQIHQKGLSSHADQSQIPPSAAHVWTDSRNSAMANNPQTPESHGVQVSQMSSSSFSAVKQEKELPFPVQGLSKQQQQHMHFSQAPFPAYGSTGPTYHPYSGSNLNSSAQSLKQKLHDSEMTQVPLHSRIGETQLGTLSQTSSSEPKRLQLGGGTLSHMTNNSPSQQHSVHWPSSTNKEHKIGALSSMTYVKQEQIDHANEQQQKSQLSTRQGLSSLSSVQVEQGNANPGNLRDESFELQSSRMGFSTSTNMMPSNPTSSSVTALLDPNTALSSRIPSATFPVGPGNNSKTPPKKPSIGQKKPLEALGSSPPPPSKKQKASGGFSDQSIEQLNDVTAVSGVNLREEEEQLFSGPKEDSRVSEASRRVVQEEEEKLILQKIPLQKKMAEIMTKCGLKDANNDVERCLSLCVEERMRGLISNLIRLSKQRVDIEKPRHRTVITSDVGQQIKIMNRKAREEWEKKQSDIEKLQKLNDPEGNNGIDGDKEKDDGRGKSVKVQANKEEDDKMRTTAANVAARAAVGGDDMLSKWQLMAEQARQKREGGSDAPSGSQPGKDVNHKSLSTSVKNARDNQESEKRSPSPAVATSGVVRKFGRNQVVVPQTRVARIISVKDVVAVLEREPQTSKSTLIYRLYEKMRTADVAE